MNAGSKSRNTVACLILAVVAGLAVAPARAEGSLNVLTWCDHEDASLLQPFEAANAIMAASSRTRPDAPATPAAVLSGRLGSKKIVHGR